MSVVAPPRPPLRQSNMAQPTGHPRGTTPLLAGLAVLGVAAALFTAARLVDPPPSRTFVIATASASSGYQEYAERYRNILAQQGVRLGIRPSLGSADNLNLLRDKSSGVQAAFSTIGAARLEDATEIVSLGGVFVTPVFVFSPVKMKRLPGSRNSAASGSPSKSRARRCTTSL